MNIKDCHTKKCYIQHVILGLVKTHVDKRAHLVRGELRYSAKVGKKRWERKSMDFAEMSRIYGELYA